MKRNFSAITLQKNILLMREKTVKVTNISTNDEMTSQSRSLQEFPRRINILKGSFERNKKDLLKPILSNVSDLSDYETYYNNFKPSKINAKESINFNNDEDEISNWKKIEKLPEIQDLRAELNQLGDMINKKYNRKTILFEKKENAKKRKY